MSKQSDKEIRQTNTPKWRRGFIVEDEQPQTKENTERQAKQIQTNSQVEEKPSNQQEDMKRQINQAAEEVKKIGQNVDLLMGSTQKEMSQRKERSDATLAGLGEAMDVVKSYKEEVEKLKREMAQLKNENTELASENKNLKKQIEQLNQTKKEREMKNLKSQEEEKQTPKTQERSKSKENRKSLSSDDDSEVSDLSSESGSDDAPYPLTVRTLAEERVSLEEFDPKLRKIFQQHLGIVYDNGFGPDDKNSYNSSGTTWVKATSLYFKKGLWGKLEEYAQENGEEKIRKALEPVFKLTTQQPNK
jgi:cell division protein FtsB